MTANVIDLRHATQCCHQQTNRGESVLDSLHGHDDAGHDDGSTKVSRTDEARQCNNGEHQPELLAVDELGFGSRSRDVDIIDILENPGPDFPPNGPDAHRNQHKRPERQDQGEYHTETQKNELQIVAHRTSFCPEIEL